MKNETLLSKLVEKIELEILTTEESALIGGSADSILAGNNCKCNGDNCDCNTGGTKMKSQQRKWNSEASVMETKETVA